MNVDVGPHEFTDGRGPFAALVGKPAFCAHCYHDEDEHPIEVWAEARPVGDKTIRRPQGAPPPRSPKRLRPD